MEKDASLVKVKDEDNRTLLHWAARGVHYEILKYLIEKGADVNAFDKNNVTALISVVARNHPKAVKLLIENGSDVNVKSNAEYTALHYAASDGFIEVVKLLIKNGAKLDIKNDYQRTPLILAARETGGLETIKILVEAGANINATDYSEDTPLSLAAWRGYEDIVNYLLDNGADLGTSTDKVKKLMSFALNKRMWKLYQKIFAEGYDLNTLSLEGISLLHFAAKGGSEQIVSDLIKKGLDVNAKDIFGWIPLHYASNYGRLNVVKILIENGSEINVKSKVEETPYNLALKAGKTEVVEFLISNGADQSKTEITNLSGEYFGQKIVSDTPQMFAPGIVSELAGGHSNVVFSPDGSIAIWTKYIESEVGYTRGGSIIYSKIKNGKWKVPTVLMENGDTPFFSVDGKKLYYLKSVRNDDGEYLIREIQYLEINDGMFSDPKTLPFDVNANGLYWQFSIDKDENIYFSGSNGLCRSIYENGMYLTCEKLTDVFHHDYIGGSPYISPNADYIIFSSRQLPNCYGELDLYIGFQNADGSWSKPINMGEKINTNFGDHLPIVSPDGKYLFLISLRNDLLGRYWTDAKIIEELRLKD